MKLFRLGLTLAMVFIALTVTIASAQTAASSAQDPLVQVLVQKGVLTADDAKNITGTPAEQRDRLLQLLKDKGVLTAADAESVRGTKAVPQPVLLPATYTTTQAKTEAPKEAPKPAAPTVIPAVAPVRVLQFEPSKPGGLIPDIKLGSGAKLKLYGFLKASAAYDSSSPYGNDFPLPGFLGIDTGITGFDIGPNKSPEFHVKARAARIGGNFEFPDISPHVAVTGKLEADYEGDFTRVANRNVSAIRSSQMSLRLAYGRVDYKGDKNNFFFLGGQDWSPFGSSILPNVVESTIYLVGFGNLYEREPQLRVGASHNFGGSRNIITGPEFAVVLSAWGNTPPLLNASQRVAIPATCTAGTTCILNVTYGPGSLGDQLAYGERQGPDSARPGIEGRWVFQFQADKAKGVGPAQIVVSGMHRNREAIVPVSLIRNFAPTTVIASGPFAGQSLANAFAIRFPHGAAVDSDSWGGSGGFSIPTRYVTLTGNYYRGTGLRWYFEGQLYQEFNNTFGLSNTFTLPAIDASATAPAFGLSAAGLPEIAQQLEPRAQGGFFELGFPLSRLFHANPAGRNAGWTLNVHYGYDSVFARDVRRASPAGGRGVSDVGLANINYKMNQFVTFAYEASYYRTRAFAGTAGQLPAVSGIPSHQWHDFRSEFFTIFTF